MAEFVSKQVKGLTWAPEGRFRRFLIEFRCYACQLRRSGCEQLSRMVFHRRDPVVDPSNVKCQLVRVKNLSSRSGNFRNWNLIEIEWVADSRDDDDLWRKVGKAFWAKTLKLTSSLCFFPWLSSLSWQKRTRAFQLPLDMGKSNAICIGVLRWAAVISRIHKSLCFGLNARKNSHDPFEIPTALAVVDMLAEKKSPKIRLKWGFIMEISQSAVGLCRGYRISLLDLHQQFWDAERAIFW